MKLKIILTIIVFIILLFDYGYCVHKTQTNPEELRWGYFCCLLFVTTFTLLVSIIVKNNK
jgi:membrane-associated HD superfamily phosphohydrolase